MVQIDSDLACEFGVDSFEPTVECVSLLIFFTKNYSLFFEYVIECQVNMPSVVTYSFLTCIHIFRVDLDIIVPVMPHMLMIPS